MLIKVVLKTFHHMMHLKLPAHLMNPENLKKWIAFMKILLDSQVPPELSSPTIDEDEMLRREKTCIWQHKKWAGRIM